MKKQPLKLWGLMAVALFLAVSVRGQSTNNQQLIDQRAKDSYTPEEISSMPEYKVLQINYLYADSWYIPQEHKNRIDPLDINISDYSAFRRDKGDARVYLNLEKTTGPYIYLKSKAEVKKQLDLIKEQYNH